MNHQTLSLEGIPCMLWSEPSNRAYLYVHGQGGCKEEAERFAAIAARHGWQVLSLDLPGHGARTAEADHFDPWHAAPELSAIMRYMRTHFDRAALYASSIGAYFSMLALADQPLEHCLFVSPVLDMRRLIANMMAWAGVTEERLEREQRIPTDFGQTLSWQYNQYAVAHPITRWSIPTHILYAGQDALTERCVVDRFVSQFHAQLTVMEDGEHWFHTPEQLRVLDSWAEAVLAMYR